MSLDVFLTAVATVGVSIALLTDLSDLKGGIVPDKLTYPLIALGLFTHAGLSLRSGNARPLLSGLEGGGIGFGVGFLVYLFGGFGAGDVKLLAAIGALVPEPVSPLIEGLIFFSLPVSPVVVLMNGLMLAAPLVFGFALLCLIKGEGVVGKEVPVSSFEGGEIPVEAVYERGGYVEVGGDPPDDSEKVYAGPSDVQGFGEEDVATLRELAGEGKAPSALMVRRTFPFVPVIAAGWYSLLLFGNLYLNLLLGML